MPPFLEDIPFFFQELIASSTMSVFTSDVYPEKVPGIDRVRVSITDPEFHVTYYLVCKKEDRKRFHVLLSESV